MTELSRMAFPALERTLTDGVVLLRPHRPDDAERIVEQSRDPRSQRWTTVPREYTLTDARKFLEIIEAGWAEADCNRYWAIELALGPDTPEGYLGTIDLRPVPHGVASTGFGMHPLGRGRGVMTRALRLACSHWFERGGRRVYWEAARGNFASWRVAWGCGFTMHATLPDHSDFPEGTEDSWLASLASSEPIQPRVPWLEPPVVEGDTGAGATIRLRPWRDDDGAGLEEPDHPAHHMPEQAALRADTFREWVLRRREHQSRGTGVNWCIADGPTDRVLGEVGVFGDDLTDRAELGYQVLPSARGRGVASAAAGLAAAYALRPADEGGLGARRLVALSAADNDASNGVLRSAGFEVFGREAAVAVLPDGSTCDGLHWQRLA